VVTAVAQEFRLPDVGEGLTEAEMATWLVQVGDVVKVNDPLCEIETAKSVVELPSPYAGTVTALLVEVGDTVNVGTPIIRIESGAPSAAASAVPPAETVESAEAPADEAPLNLVGSGPKAQHERRPRTRPTYEPHAPAARAREEAPTRGASADSAPVSPAPAPAAAATPAGRETREVIKGVRKEMANAMVTSSAVPSVTIWTEADVTRTVELVAKLKKHPEFRDVKVSPLLVVAKACILALKRTPLVNSTWDDSANEVVLKHYVNLGIAAATPRGLLVPNIKDADGMRLDELAKALEQLVKVARDGKTPPPDLARGTFTITNVGPFGVDCGAPILNPGESGILCLGAIRRRPWVVGEGADERIAPRDVVTLSLTFDHRHIDGETGSKFLADVASIVTDPATALLF
jgi:pyruvate dehydrogenase E2 component (dihydrolipoamide acetyltransferase)